MKYFRPIVAVGNSFTRSAPALWAAIISLGVSAPGMDISPKRLVSAMTAGSVFGETIYFAPASYAART